MVTKDLPGNLLCDALRPDSMTGEPGTCPLDAVLRHLMGPWTTYILWLLQTQGELRFGALKSLMQRISSKVLTDRLRHLERAGLISRTYEPTIPPTVTYALTSRGHELRQVLADINGIALRWRAEDGPNGPVPPEP
jgi:DNA-binding HxlR family transcriptional regulator